MTEQEIRDAGLAIDVPFESGMATPQRLRYGTRPGAAAEEETKPEVEEPEAKEEPEE